MDDAHRVWYKHPAQCWALGDVHAQADAEHFTIADARTGEMTRIPMKDTQLCDPSHLLDVADIATMNNMHEAPLLDLLRRRYMKDVIYTFTGEILISINPYRMIEGLYDIPPAQDELHDFDEDRVPHVFAVAHRAYHQMLQETRPEKKNQSMIISGESGAGKTEAAKQVMKYLAVLSERFCRRATKSTRGRGRASMIENIEMKVLKCNPFLEGFGNAKTLRNNNSSRFGKFLKIQYAGGAILGAYMEHYLLEKARVVNPLSGERNFHVFYQLVRGLHGELREELGLTSVADYTYLTAGDCSEVEDMDDQQEFDDVVGSLTVVGIGPTQQAQMWRILAGILQLGNVTFKEEAHASGDAKAVVANPDVVATASGLLGTPLLAERLVTQRMKVGLEVVQRHQDARRAAGTRDALSKHVYNSLFSWMVSRVNSTLAVEDESSFIGILDIFGFEIFKVNSFEQLCINYANEKLQSLFNHHVFTLEQAIYREEGVDVTTISFRNNQPCVALIENSTAPHGILTLLDDVCRNARKDMTDRKFLAQLDSTHKGKHEYYGNTKRVAVEKFTVKHFAGEVTYSVSGFIEKNMDKLNDDIVEMLAASSHPLIRELYAGSAEAGRADSLASPGRTRAKAAPTIASKFKKQLSHLHGLLLDTAPHYVRTIKPNEVKRPQVFDAPKILEQLLYSGVLETVRIRREGYPFRESFLDFWRRATNCGRSAGYTCLVKGATALPPAPAPMLETQADGRVVDHAATSDAIATAKQGTRMVVSALLEPEQWAAGHSKVFLKDGCLEFIHEMFRKSVAGKLAVWMFTRVKWLRFRMWRAHLLRRRIAIRMLMRRYAAYLLRKRYESCIRQITRLQAHVRRRQAVRRYATLAEDRQAGALALQRVWRGGRVRARVWATRRRLVRLQARVRGAQARQVAARRKAALLLIQRSLRGAMARKRFARLQANRGAAACKIQTWWRMVSARSKYSALLAARYQGGAVKLQSWVRGCKARAIAKHRKQAAHKIQAMVRMAVARKAYQSTRGAALRLTSWIVGVYRAWSLREWVAETFACAANGYVEDVAELLDRSMPDYRWLRDIPMKQLVSVRDRDDGFKSLLHAASLSGDLDTVRLLVQQGASAVCVDAGGSTPLHKSAAVGDTHLAIVQYLATLVPVAPDARAEAAGKHRLAQYVPKGGALAGPDATPTPGSGWRAAWDTARHCYVNTVNVAGETALDGAVSSQRARGRREHDETIRFLLDVGCVCHSLGTRAAVQAVLDAASSDAALAAVNAAREKEFLERRRAEREANPHYQFLLVQERERERSVVAAGDAQRSNAAAAAQDRMAARAMAAGSAALWEAGPPSTPSQPRGVPAPSTPAGAMGPAKSQGFGVSYAGGAAVVQSQPGLGIEDDILAAVGAHNRTASMGSISRGVDTSSPRSRGMSESGVFSPGSALRGAARPKAALVVGTPTSASGAKTGGVFGLPAVSAARFGSAEDGATPSAETAGGSAAQAGLRQSRGSGASGASGEGKYGLSGHSAQGKWGAQDTVTFALDNAELQALAQGAASANDDVRPRAGSELFGSGRRTQSTCLGSTGASLLATLRGGQTDIAAVAAEAAEMDAAALSSAAPEHKHVRSATVAVTRGVAPAALQSSTSHGRSASQSARTTADFLKSVMSERGSEPGVPTQRTAAADTADDFDNVMQEARKQQQAQQLQSGAGRTWSTASQAAAAGAGSYAPRTASMAARSASMAARSASVEDVPRAQRPAVQASLAGAQQSPEAAAREEQRRQMQQAAAHSSEPVWSVHESKSTQLLYYFNRVTGDTQWEEPASFDSQYEPWQLEVLRRTATVWTPAMAAASQASTGKGVPSAQTSLAAKTTRAAGMEAVLAEAGDEAEEEDGPPERWTVHSSSEGYTYYYDEYTGASTWDMPACLQTQQQSSGAEQLQEGNAAHPAGDDVVVGGGGWCSLTSPEGYVYYWHEGRDVTTWVRPAEF